MRIAVVNLKGGVGKTTTAMYLAAGFHRLGRTLLIDADRQKSAKLWSLDDALFPFLVLERAERDVNRVAQEVGSGYEHVVIDTPPGDLGVVRSAVMAVDTVIVPVAPTGLDVNRLRPTFELLQEMEPVHPFMVGVVLTRVRRGTLSARGVRDVLAEIGYPVMDTEIPLAEQYAASFGTYPLELGAYDDLLTELKS